MTYAILQADVISWAQRSDIASVVPTWIRLATSVFNRKLRVPEMETRSTLVCTTEYTALPAEFLEVRASKDAASRGPRYLASQQFAVVVAQGDSLDVPIFTIEELQLRIYPAPTVAAPVSVTVSYYRRLPALVNASDVNWLLTDYPDLYLYGSLVHGAAWLHDAGRIVAVKALHDEALSDLAKRKVHATGIVSVMDSGVPITPSQFDMTRGY